MSNEPKSDDKTIDAWVMPEPVFRTTPGHTPKVGHLPDPAADFPTEPGFSDAGETEDLASPSTVDLSADDIPTEPGFSDAPTIEIEGLQAREAAENAPIKVASTPPTPKKRGCARSFMTVVSLIVLAVIGVVVALIYFIFYYKSADTGTF